jgi:hypothetical protein
MKLATVKFDEMRLHVTKSTEIESLRLELGDLVVYDDHGSTPKMFLTSIKEALSHDSERTEHPSSSLSSNNTRKARDVYFDLLIQKRGRASNESPKTNTGTVALLSDDVKQEAPPPGADVLELVELCFRRKMRLSVDEDFIGEVVRFAGLGGGGASQTGGGDTTEVHRYMCRMVPNRNDGESEASDGIYASQKDQHRMAKMGGGGAGGTRLSRLVVRKLQIYPIRATVSLLKTPHQAHLQGGLLGFFSQRVSIQISNAPLTLKAVDLSETSDSPLDGGSKVMRFPEMVRQIRESYFSQTKKQLASSAQVTEWTGWVDHELAHVEAISRFQVDSLSKSGFIAKFEKKITVTASRELFEQVLMHMAWDWFSNHRGIQSQQVVIIGVVNFSAKSINIQTTLDKGHEILSLPKRRSHLPARCIDDSNQLWYPNRSLVILGFGGSTIDFFSSETIEVTVESEAFKARLAVGCQPYYRSKKGFSCQIFDHHSFRRTSHFLLVVHDQLSSSHRTTTGTSSIEVLSPQKSVYSQLSSNVKHIEAKSGLTFVDDFVCPFCGSLRCLLLTHTYTTLALTLLPAVHQ